MEEGRRFKAKKKEPREVWFEIEDTSGYAERFDCRPAVPGSLLWDHQALLAKGGYVAVEAMRALFVDAMEPPEYERFRKFVDDPHREIESDTLSDAWLYLLGVYARERPTVPSSASTPGSGETGPTSTDG